MASVTLDPSEYVVAVLDDRSDQRETVIRSLDNALPKGWSCIECPLREDINDYPKWLIENRVVCLLIDQLLNENASQSDLPVDYKGNQVITVIRGTLPDLPIYVISQAVDSDADLQANWGAADEAISRIALTERIDDYVERIMRRASSFLNRNTEQLAKFNELSTEAAKGTITGERLKELRAIQSELSLPDQISTERDDALSSLEGTVSEFEKLRTKIDSFLSKNANKSASKKAVPSKKAAASKASTKGPKPRKKRI